jgi:ABC-type branched-subunit amino acid transport system substrate-binding protein
VRAIAGLVLATSVTTACSNSGSSSTPSAGPEVRRIQFASDKPDGALVVGVVVAQSGADTARERGIVEVLTAVAKVHAGAGSAGRPIELRVADTTSTVDGARVATDRVLGEGAQIVVAGCDDEQVLAIARRARAQQRVTLSACTGDDPLVAQAGDLFFPIGPTNTAQGRALAEHLMASGHTAVAIVDELDPDSGASQCNVVAERIRQLGGEIIVQSDARSGADAAMAAIATDVATLGATSAIAVCGGATLVAKVVEAARAQRSTAPIRATALADGPPWAVTAEPGDTSYLSGFAVDPVQPDAAALVAAGAPTSPGTAWLAAMLLEWVVRAAGTTADPIGTTLAAAITAQTGEVYGVPLRVDSSRRVIGTGLYLVGAAGNVVGPAVPVQ